MKRLTLSAIIAVCAVTFTVNARIGATADQKKVPKSNSLRAIAIEVLIVETKGGAKDDRIVEIYGPSDKVAARVRELESKGRLDVIDRMRLTTLENQKALIQVGRETAVRSSRSFGGRGGVARTSFQRQQVGTLVSVIAKVAGDAVDAELTVEKSDLERRAPAAKPQPDGGFVPLATDTLSYQGTVHIPSGTTILVGGCQTKSERKSTQSLVLVSARILGGSSKPNVRARGAADKNELRIFALKNAVAKEAAEVIEELFGENPQIKIGVDSRTNSLIINAGPKQLEVIQAILLKLDEAAN